MPKEMGDTAMKNQPKSAAGIEAQVDGLASKAASLADLAKTQRTSADLQEESSHKLHVEAHKLELLSDQLAADIASIKQKL
jgi:hypothetical protein